MLHLTEICCEVHSKVQDAIILRCVASYKKIWIYILNLITGIYL